MARYFSNFWILCIEIILLTILKMKLSRNFCNIMKTWVISFQKLKIWHRCHKFTIIWEYDTVWFRIILVWECNVGEFIQVDKNICWWFCDCGWQWKIKLWSNSLSSLFVFSSYLSRPRFIFNCPSLFSNEHNENTFSFSKLCSNNLTNSQCSFIICHVVIVTFL